MGPKTGPVWNEEDITRRLTDQGPVVRPLRALERRYKWSPIDYTLCGRILESVDQVNDLLNWPLKRKASRSGQSQLI